MNIAAELIERARSVPIESVINQRGIKLRGKIERVGPCPQCGGTDRFAINTKKQVFNCRGCAAGGDVIALVQFLEGISFREACGVLAGAPRRHEVDAFDQAWVNAKAEDRRRTEDDFERIKRAAAIWQEGREPRGTLAETYLGLRALELTDELAGRVLRFHPRCPWRNENTGKTERVPALIAAFRSLDDDAVTAIHRIALNPDGSKVGRRMLGVVQRAAVKLDPTITTGTLAVGEGVETCMAARQLGIRPCWALGSTGMISFFPIMPNVTTLRIVGERGPASSRAIELCGTRWRQAGCRVRVIQPTGDNDDLNDTLMRERGHGS